MNPADIRRTGMAVSDASRVRIHASTVAIGEAGILIRGPSGAGKSTLALALVDLAGRNGRFARLVADDRTQVEARHGRLTARPVAPLEGLVERRGLGLTPEPHLPAVVVRLIVDLGDEPARMPDPEDLVDRLAGIDLPRLRVPAGQAGQERLVLAGLALFLSRD